MDSIKEIYDAFSQKIRSPFLGHIVIAFVLWNWKAIYYVIYSGKPALMKFNYFDANVVGWSYVVPVAVGILTALASPYISNWGSLWATKPVHARRLREKREAHKILVEDNRLLAERENSQRLHRKELAGDEQELIDKAKRDLEIDQLPDGVKDEVQKQVQELRNGDSPVKAETANKLIDSISEKDALGLTTFEKLVLEYALKSNEPFFHDSMGWEINFRNRKFKETLSTINELTKKLINHGLIEETSNSNPKRTEYQLTNSGKEYQIF